MKLITQAYHSTTSLYTVCHVSNSFSSLKGNWVYISKRPFEKQFRCFGTLDSVHYSEACDNCILAVGL